MSKVPAIWVATIAARALARATGAASRAATSAGAPGSARSGGPRTSLRRGACALGAAAALGACGDSDTTTPGAGEPLDGVEQPTFYQHAGPIFNDKCVRCHQEDGIAPFRLDSYETAREWSNRIVAVTEQRIMPPYLIDVGGDCGSFEETEALSDAEIQTIAEWVAAGTPEGTPAEMTPPQLTTLEGTTEWLTPDFTPEPVGDTLALFDEYRCFRMPMNVGRDTWITGAEVVPGNDQLVHHVLGFVVDPDAPSEFGMTNGELMQALDDESADREGWPCFGAAGEGVNVESVPIGWAPGFGALPFPDRMGVRARQNRELVIQMHYNMADPTVIGESDQTRVKLRLEDEVERQAIFLLNDRLLETLGTGAPDMIPPGEENATYTWEAPMSELLGAAPPIPLELVGISPHMHERGTRYTLELGDDGAFECAGRINRWDFNWQRQYNYVTRPELRANTVVRLTCEYDTSADTEPVMPGWGTRNEMCTNSMMIAFPTGFFLP